MADKNFYINFDRGIRTNSDGSQDASVASLYYQEVPNWTIKFIDTALAGVDLSGVSAWACAVDDDFDDASDPWVRVLDADIDSTDSANGNITVPVDSNTATFLAGIGEDEYKQVYFELRGLDGSGALIAYVRFSLLAKNTLDPSGGVPPGVVGDYWNKTESSALFVDVAGDTMTGDLNMNGGDIIYANEGATATPPQLNMGSSYYSGTPDNDKLTFLLYDHPTTTLRSGIGFTLGKMNYMGGNTIGHYFYVNDSTTASMSIDTSGLVNVANSIETPFVKESSASDVAWTTATKTLALTEAGSEINANSASAMDLTIPTNASVAFDIGAKIVVYMIGAGVVTPTGDTGVTVNGVSAGSGAMTQYEAVCLKKIDTNEWLAIGNITIA